MQQTLLVLLGVILVGLYGYALHDRNTAEENDAIRREVETAALGVATDWSTRLQQFRFDQIMIDSSRTVPPHSDTLTYSSPVSSFGLQDPGETSRCLINDVDDFDGLVDTTSYGLRFGEADFRVEFDVRYADHADVSLLPAAGVSNVKVATITATYIEPTADTTAWAFKPPVRVSVDAVLSNAVLTIRHRMRMADNAEPPVVFSGC